MTSTGYKYLLARWTYIYTRVTAPPAHVCTYVYACTYAYAYVRIYKYYIYIIYYVVYAAHGTGISTSTEVPGTSI